MSFRSNGEISPPLFFARRRVPIWSLFPSDANNGCNKAKNGLREPILPGYTERAYSPIVRAVSTRYKCEIGRVSVLFGIANSTKGFREVSMISTHSSRGLCYLSINTGLHESLGNITLKWSCGLDRRSRKLMNTFPPRFVAFFSHGTAAFAAFQSIS